MEDELKCPVKECDGILIDIGINKGKHQYLCDCCNKKFNKDEINPSE